MRVGATVLLVDGMCYQSYNWNKYRPLGALQHVVDMLEEYHCDEIAIIRPARNNDSFSAFKHDVEVLKHINTMTPISFGGGVRDSKALHFLKDLPVERLIFSSAFIKQKIDLISEATQIFGRQAIQCLLPCAMKSKELQIFCCDNASYVPVKQLDQKIIDEYANEVVIYDLLNEGEVDSFDFSLLDQFSFSRQKIVVSGGIGSNSIGEANRQQLASVLVDNKVLHSEYSIKGYKHAAKL